MGISGYYCRFTTGKKNTQKNKSRTKLMSVLLYVNCEHILNSFLRLVIQIVLIFSVKKDSAGSYCKGANTASVLKKSILLKQNAYLQSKR